MNEFYLVKESN